jgi:outer membrane protein assembly factor BamB
VPLGHTCLEAANHGGRVLAAVGNLALQGNWVSGEVVALDAQSGGLLWRQRVPDAINGLTLGNGLVVATVDIRPSGDFDAYPTGRMVALDAATGAERWTRKTPDRLSAPAMAGHIVYTTGEFGNLYAVNAVTGEDAWRLTIGEGRSGNPIVAKGLLLVPIGDALYAFQ